MRLIIYDLDLGQAVDLPISDVESIEVGGDGESLIVENKDGICFRTDTVVVKK